MGEVADRAGVSRQALYLHFAGRADLFLEVSRYADATARTPSRQRRVDLATTGRDALREAIALQAYLKPRLQGVLHDEGEVAPGWDIASAARCLWAVTSQRVWDDLVIDQGWSTARYRKHITALLESALLR